MLKLGFEDLGFHRIDAKLDALNTDSAALCERLGMRLESRQVDKWHYKDERATEVVYTIPAEEWKARQQVSGGRRRAEPQSKGSASKGSTDLRGKRSDEVAVCRTPI